ncbi:MAG: radical SAM protein [Candidatus Hodarchaeales archaeon]
MHSTCQICNKRSEIFAGFIGICPECIRKYPEYSIELSKDSHMVARNVWKLPKSVPDTSDVECHICSNQCRISEGNLGYCGIRSNHDGSIQNRAGKGGFLHTYLDPLPTNCCNTYFCPAGTNGHISHYSYADGPEFGYYNLACFLYGCNFSCFGCQNDQHRNIDTAEHYSVEKFVKRVNSNSRISCVCFFGGSPEPQLPFAIRAARKALSGLDASRSILRICWEWNGSGNEKLIVNAVKLSAKSGGNAKFDLKYASPPLSEVLSGVSNQQSYHNFKVCYDKFYASRPDYPLLSATTLLLPGYVDVDEVEGIARFLSSLDRSIPYSLLLFHPDSFLSDLPVTPRKQVNRCYEIAQKYLDNVHIGNKHLLY